MFHNSNNRVYIKSLFFHVIISLIILSFDIIIVLSFSKRDLETPKCGTDCFVSWKLNLGSINNNNDTPDKMQKRNDDDGTSDVADEET